MHIDPNSSHLQRYAEKIQLTLSALNEPAGLSRCQYLGAVILGFESWDILKEAAPFVFDEADSETLDVFCLPEKRNEQITRLLGAGLDRPIANYLLETLVTTAPNFRGWGTKASICEHISVLAAAFSSVQTFYLYCDGPDVGKLDYRVFTAEGYKVVNDPVNRTALAMTARRIFGEGNEVEHHPDRVNVQGEHPFSSWRTQWYGKDFFPAYSGIHTNFAFVLVGMGLRAYVPVRDQEHSPNA